jgi:histone H3/H4
MAKATAKKGSKGGGGGGSRKEQQQAAAANEMLLVASKVRQIIKDAGCNTAGDALEGLNAYVGWLVVQATKRATENGRKTVRAHDFMIF